MRPYLHYFLVRPRPPANFHGLRELTVPLSSSTLFAATNVDLGHACLCAPQKTAYEHYDIIIWSATSMQWVELKMKELGVLSNPDYKITCLMDCLARKSHRQTLIVAW